MDDGSYRFANHTITIFTNKFTNKEVDRLVAGLKKKFNIQCHRRYENKTPTHYLYNGRTQFF